MTFISFLLIIFAYLFGSTSFAILVCKIFNKPDPRNAGSMNPGTTNVLRLAGKKAAIFTLAGDIFKGFLPIFIAKLLNQPTLIIALVGLAAFLGHLYPIFLKFKGGKGVATALGVYIGLNPILGLVIVLSWIICSLIFNMSSLSALVATFITPFLFYIVTHSLTISIILALITLFIFWRHRENIKNIKNGNESKIIKK